MKLSGAACWVPLDANGPCSCYSVPLADSRGFNSNQVKFKQLENPSVH